MKLKYTFESVNMENEIILVPVGEGAENMHGILKVNSEAFEIIELLHKETTVEMLINELSKKYDNNEVMLRNYISIVVNELSKADLLDK